MNKDLLFKILRIEAESYDSKAMMAFLAAHAKEKGYQHFYDTTGNFYMVKGQSKTYPCMVAHTDTVHKIHGHGISIIRYGSKVTGFDGVDMEQTGIGGDDKCGIYAALHCMEALEYCKAAFFVDEEVGCKGSRRCYMKFFKNCRFVLQADRRGNDDFVTDIFGPLSSDKFQRNVLPIITKYDYKFHTGAMTDVEALRDNNIGLSVANMSAGYYNPHSDREYIDLDDLERVCLMMEEIARTMTRTYPFTRQEPKWGKVFDFPAKSHSAHGGGGSTFHGSFREEFPDWEPGSIWIDGRFVSPSEEQDMLIEQYVKNNFMTAEEAAKLLKEDTDYEKKMTAREYERSVMGAD